MGWKKIRDHYRIEHIVHVRDGCLAIGSPMMPTMLTVTPDGKVRSARNDWGRNDAGRIRREIEADPALFALLFDEPDAFDASIPVYTWRDGCIVEDACEEAGWPNVTHAGELMYENRIFTDRGAALAAALADAAAGEELYERDVARLEEDLVKAKERLEEQRGFRRMLEEAAA